MYSGQYNLQLDEQDRFRIPPKLKTKLGERIFLTRGLTKNSKCLFVYSEKGGELLREKVDAVPMFSDPEAIETLREIFTNGDEPDADPQGRYKLMKKLKDWAGIKKGIVFTTTGSRVEMWSEENWAKYEEENPMTPEKLNDLFKKLGQYGL